MEIFTIGFTQKSAERFFALLTESKVQLLLDTRLNNTGQLSGFAKRDDLAYFLSLHGIAYRHEPDLAPTQELLDRYRKEKGTWQEYEQDFLKLLKRRRIETLNPALFSERTALLCSEATADHCHRRLVADYLAAHWDGITITHL